LQPPLPCLTGAVWWMRHGGGVRWWVATIHRGGVTKMLRGDRASDVGHIADGQDMIRSSTGLVTADCGNGSALTTRGVLSGGSGHAQIYHLCVLYDGVESPECPQCGILAVRSSIDELCHTLHRRIWFRRRLFAAGLFASCVHGFQLVAMSTSGSCVLALFSLGHQLSVDHRCFFSFSSYFTTPRHSIGLV
jgi:hypothetical protein